MKKLLIVTVLSAVVFISNRAKADESEAIANAASNANLKINSVSIREVQPTATELAEDLMNSPPPTRSRDASMNLNAVDLPFDLNDVLTIGQKVYDIVKENQPVVSVKRTLVSVVPGGAADWTQLQGWQAPVTKVFEVTVKNLYNLTTADIRLKVTGNYGGNANGVGHYLANVNMVPSKIYAAWGYNVDVSVETANGVNTGTAADPVAGLTVDLRYHVHTLLSDVSGDQDYWITGKGNLTTTN